MRNEEVMTYEQVIKLISQTVQDLQLDIDLSGYISQGDLNAIYLDFEQSLAKKVDTETYTQKMIEIENKIKDISKINLPIDLSSEDYVSNILGVKNGGTGASSINEAQYNLLKDLNVKSTDLEDNDYLVYSKPDQSEENGSLGKVQTFKLWDWMKDKIEDDFPLESSSIISNDKIDSLF